jgi:hypothetical protein
VQLKRRLGAVWGVAGITLIIGSAIVRVAPKAIDAFRVGLNPFQWTILVVWVTFMLIGEGYRGFQLKFSPRVAARMWHLLQHGRSVDLWLAPFYCVGFFGSSMYRMISCCSLSGGVTLIFLFVVELAL